MNSSLSNTNSRLENPLQDNQAEEWDNISNASSVVMGDPEISWEVFDRIMGWFEGKGVKAGIPEDIIEDFQDQHKRQISLRSDSHINAKPALSRRVKKATMLHIDISFHTHLVA